MPQSLSSSDDASSVWIPSDQDIEKAIRDLCMEKKGEDLKAISSKKWVRWISRKLSVAVDDLTPKRDFIKQYVKHEIETQQKEEEGATEKEAMPTEKEIQEAAKTLAKKLDMESTSIKRFTRLLCDDLDLEDLTFAESIIASIYEKAVAQAEAAEGQTKEAMKPSSKKIRKSRSSNAIPSDEEIVQAAKRLAANKDLHETSKAKFLRMLQKRMGGVDLASKKDLVYGTFKQCRAEQYPGRRPSDARISEGTTTAMDPTSMSFVTQTSITTDEQMQRLSAHPIPMVTMMRGSTSQVEPDDIEAASSPKKAPDHPRKSEDLPLAKDVPEATGLTWTDGFFDKDKDNLVAVFDHVRQSVVGDTLLYALAYSHHSYPAF
jgi:hypothetical protein